MNPTRIILAALGLTMLLAFAAAADEEAPRPDNRSIRWQDYRQARERAAAESKPLLVYFTNDSDEYCTKMRLKTLSDNKVIRYLNANYAMCSINPEQMPSLAAKFDVDSLPTLWFLDAAGKRLTHVGGFVDTERLMPLLVFIFEAGYEHTDYESWLKRRK